MAHVYEPLFHHSPSGVLIVDDEGVVERANRAADALFAHDGGLVGRRLDELFPSHLGPRHQPGRRERLTRLISGSSTTAVEVTVSGGDGTERPVEIRSIPTPNAGGRFVVLSDVSEREQARRQLEEAQAINRMGAWSFDLVRNVVWWSPELFRILQLPVADEAPAFETHHRLFSADSWARLEPAVAAAAERGTPYELQLELTARDAEGPRLAVARCQPQVDEQGKVVRLVGTFQDVTETARAERQRRGILDRLAVARSAADLAIWEWDLETDELIWDARMRELYGIPNRPVRYEDWQRAVHPADLDAAERHLRKVVAGQGRFRHQFRIRTASGERHILAVASVIRDEPADPGRVVGVNMAVTDKVRNEEELRRANSLESLGLLAGGIAHDFNNLLTTILALTETLQLSEDDPTTVRETAEALCGAVENASQLTHQLLTFAKGGAPVRRVVSMARLLREQVQFASRGSATEIAFALDPQLWPADVDPGQVGQVIQNLVLNAHQAMPRGGRLVIEARNVDDGAEKAIEVTFADNGAGMPEDVQQRIFDPYFTTKAEGHGLGLSICHSIVERHGGSIRVESTQGEGTRFTLRLPASQERVEEPPRGQEVERGGGRVLVVDDLDGVRKAFGRLLRALGYEVALARTVEEAIDTLQNAYRDGARFDLVLTDLTMPGSEGGLAICRRAKELDPGLKVVVASGYANDPVLQQHQHHGFDAKLSKPVSAQDLSATLTELLGGSSSVPQP